MRTETGTGRKRRPRPEWVVQRETHEALITDAQAEAILTRLEAFAPSRERHREGGYALAGLLATPDGRLFHGDRGSYRVRGRQVKAEAIDRIVLAEVVRDIQTPAFVRAVTAAAKAGPPAGDVEAVREALGATEKRLARLLALVEQTDRPEPLLRQMEAVEAERVGLAERLAIHQAEAAERAAVARITEHEVRRAMVDTAAMLEGAAPDEVRVTLQRLLSRVELDGDEIRAHYRIGRPGKGRGLELAEVGRVKAESPWGRHL